jgi:hypothetical protein
MNLENVTVEMRPRSEWEAADFGVRMIRRDAAAIYRVWFAITLPLISLAVLAIIYSPYPIVATLAYWWLEPLVDGPILRIISRRLFGENADVRAALRSVFSLAWRNKIFLLTPYRFHFARSTAMPVTQLEGLSGADRRSRAKVLNLKIMNHGTGVTVAYQHLALALYFGVILLGFALVPTDYQDSLGSDWMGAFWQDSSRFSGVLSLLIVYFAQTALQPWFVGAGFGLYINCRTQLEAWDIEVAFRRMVQRRSGGLATAVVVAILMSPVMLLPDAACSQESDAADETSLSDPGFSGFWVEDEVQPALKVILEDEALATSREVEGWYSISEDDSSPDTSGLSGDWGDWLAGVGRLLSFVVEFSLWIVVAILLYVIFMTRDFWMPYLGRYRKAAPVATRVILSSGELSAESLPDDVPSEVMRLWNAGSKRGALSLLYRSSVFAAVTRHGVRLPPSATEGVCVVAIGQQTDASQADYFRRVVAAWIRCAYGYQVPNDEAMQPLCDEWSKYYGEVA